MKETSIFIKKYNHKIVTLKQLINNVGSLPKKRNKKVILCHGNFDVVHPGHIRHLVYAKSKAEILVVSITADKMIRKGIYRPHFPERLRALNLAALEIVDYVLIDKNKTPLNNIKLLKPNFFAKGFEYSKKMPQETIDEKEAVEKFRGEIIFSPGDIIYSSSNIINKDAPRIEIDKLLSVMDEHNIDFNKIKEFLEKKKLFKVHVIGDLIIDKYTKTSLIGHQAKTPTPSLVFQKETSYVGGAGIVALHLKKCGLDTTFTSVVGKDKNAVFAENFLRSHGIKTNLFIDKSRGTTEKNVIIANDYRMVKIDKVDNTPISLNALDFLTDKIKKHKQDAIIFSDFRHGIFNKFSINTLTEIVTKLKNVLTIADSQVASRWGNICDFKNFDLITPNEKEARFSLADQDSNISDLTRQLKKESNFKNLILKLGPRGIFVVSTKPKNISLPLPSFSSNVIDPVGAGDALLSYATYMLLASKSIILASIVGSMAAACECEIDGNEPVSIEQVLKKIEDWEKKVNNF
jgi:rfaE bifunctional protein kinase chain/domain